MEEQVETEAPKRKPGRPRKKRSEQLGIDERTKRIIDLERELRELRTQDFDPSEHEVEGADGQTYVQRNFSLQGPTGDDLKPGDRVRVYNKLKTNLHCSDTVIGPFEEASILAEDLRVKSIAENVVMVAG